MSDQRVAARELRRQIRRWRRGRADASVIAVVNDVYVAVVCTLLLGSMLGSVLFHTGALTADACHAGPCQVARFWGPWLVVLTALAATGPTARLFGPIFVSGASASWLLTTPVSRRGLLLAPLLCSVAAAAGLLDAGALGATIVAGFGPTAVAGSTIAATLAGIAVIGAWALAQGGGGGRVRAAAVWVPGMAVEAMLLLAWRGDLPARPVPEQFDPHAGWVLAALAGCALAASTMAVLRLDRVRSRDLVAGGRLGTGLSGALATLDLALVYDVVIAERWRRRAKVRARRGGPSGVWALAWPDVVRLGRSPSRIALLLAAVPVAYAADALGAGASTAPIAELVGFLAALPLLSGLRVLTRTTGLARMLPFSTFQARAASLVLPACCLLGYGVLVLGATTQLLPIALGALAAAVRWVTGRPPDYGRPLISTPAGAAPANLYGSIFRGFDIVLLTGLPLLIPNGEGAALSLVLSVVVLAVLLKRR